MVSTDLSSLRARASAGELHALTALGKRLLLGEGVAPVPKEGIDCLEKAAARGDGEATAQLALLDAWGILRPRNLETALDRLQRAAELGWEPSQRELRFLARGEGNDWARLRQQVDITSWTAPPAVRVLRDAPHMRTCEGFASPAECDWLIELARRGLRRAMIYRKEAAGHEHSHSRTNTESDYTFANADIVLNLVRARLAAAAGIESRYFEVAKLLHYEPGQQFDAHCDFQEPVTAALRQEIAQHGQRVATLLVYLNDDYAGGETDFPRIGLRYKGARGDALLFASVKPSGELDYDTLHAGLPPASGVKWVLSQWVRDRPVGPA
jgi:hypothetical protein